MGKLAFRSKQAAILDIIRLEIYASSAKQAALAVQHP